jgi:hypothetical protein
VDRKLIGRRQRTMERLTNSDKEIPTLVDNAEYWLQVYFKLKDYEDLEEQGRLIKLPCKVGDDIYYILGIPNETPCTIDKCVFELSDINDIGKTLFLTKSEAEARLKELRGNQNGKV